jgi:hypothetical protein
MIVLVYNQETHLYRPVLNQNYEIVMILLDSMGLLTMIKLDIYQFNLILK